VAALHCLKHWRVSCQDCTGSVTVCTACADLPCEHAVARIAALEAECLALRRIVVASVEAIGNGAFCSETSSLEFLSHVPDEIRLAFARAKTEAPVSTAGQSTQPKRSEE
jgi:hypothetical protein